MPDNPGPEPADQWVAVARDLAARLAADPATGDRAARRRRAVQDLADTGLTTLLGPARYGGAEQPWTVAHRVVRTLAAADAEIAELVARHYVWYWIAEFIGTDEKIQHIGEVSTRARWFYSGATDPRAAELTVTDAGDVMLFDGRIAPAVGGDVSTLTILQGVRPGTSTPISALAYTSHRGIAVAGDDGARIEVVAADIPWTGALGHVDKTFRPRPYNGLLAPTLDLVLLDVAIGARAEDGPDARAVDDLVAAAQLLHDRRRTVTEAEVEAHAERVAAVAATVRAHAGAGR